MAASSPADIAWYRPWHCAWREPAHLIDINGLAELAGMTVIDSILRIGACVRHAVFDAGTLPGAAGALLRKVVRYRIRTPGTFCGSVANANSASEWCCVMAAFGGVVVVRSRRGIRRLHAHEFFQGMATALKEDKPIVAAELPLLADDARTGFEEFSLRKSNFAIAMALVSDRLDRGVMVEPRLAIGGAEPLPRRVTGLKTCCAGALPARMCSRKRAKRSQPRSTPWKISTIPRTAEVVCTLVQRPLEGAQ
jgi:aerobic carbon-monoxide dehydrogenase medium subunit